MDFPYDKEDENGHKVREVSNGRGGIKEIDLTVMFERPGRRVTGNIDILVYEGLCDRNDVKNVARPLHYHAAAEARRRIERAREDGLTPGEAIGVRNEEDGTQHDSFSDALDHHEIAADRQAESVMEVADE